MLRTALVTATAVSLALTACQSGGSRPGDTPEPPGAEAPAQPPARTPAETPDTQPDPSEKAPAEKPEAAGPEATDRPEVVLEDGQDLMSLAGLPPRDHVPVADIPAEDLTTRDGIYTLEQAARGAELVKSTCSECHDPEDWRERGFLGRWAGESTYQLWYYINDRMPYRNPWSLSRQQVTDALAYILYVNELPPGDQEMGITDDDIDDYWIVWDAPS